MLGSPGCRVATICGLALVAVGPASAQWRRGPSLHALDAQADMRLGNAVAAGDHTLAVGAYQAVRDGLETGAAYVYVRDGVSWIEAPLVGSNAADGDEFGFAVAIDADRVVVGAPRHDGADTDAGAVYVFRREGADWVEEARLFASDARALDHFGHAVAIDAPYLIVGSPFDDDDGSNSGAAYVFVREGAAWTEQTKLLPQSGAAGSHFGNAVAIDGEVVVVGAPRADQGASNAGAAYVFTYDGSAWQEEALLAAAVGETDDRLGESVGVSGAVVVAGAPNRDGAGGNAVGAAHVFVFDGAAWQRDVWLVPSDGEASDHFGASVAVDGDRIVAGSRFNDQAALSAGAVYVFRSDEAGWQADAKLMAASPQPLDFFGAAVAVHGSRVVVGATGDDDMGDSAGAGYIFEDNAPPLCDAGGPYQFECGGTAFSVMALDGSGVSDAEGDPLSYTWSADSPAVSFDDPFSRNPVVTITGVTCPLTSTITLTVSDGLEPPVSCDTTLVMDDTRPPKLRCPDPVDVASGDPIDPTFLGTPQVGDCDPDPTLEYSDSEDLPACPASAVERTIVRTWTATDACGNANSCDQTIRVMKTTLPADMVPGKCPNKFNPKRGALEVVLFGTAEADAAAIDPASLGLFLADCAEGLQLVSDGEPNPSVRFEDAGSAGGKEDCACGSNVPDGLTDAVLEFRIERLDAGRDAPATLVVSGMFDDGRAFVASDCVRVTGRRPKPHTPAPAVPEEKDPKHVDPVDPGDPAPAVDECGAGGALAVPLTLMGLTAQRYGRGRRRRGGS